MKNDAISRSAAVKEIESIALQTGKDKVRTVARCSNAIELLPGLDVQPVMHARWIYGITLSHEWRKCSECLVSQEIFGSFTYCPNCGARMDAEETPK